MADFTRYDLAKSWQPRPSKPFCENCTPLVNVAFKLYENKVQTMDMAMKNVKKKMSLPMEDEDQNEDIPISKAVDYVMNLENDFEKKKTALEAEAVKKSEEFQAEKENYRKTIDALEDKARKVIGLKRYTTFLNAQLKDSKKKLRGTEAKLEMLRRRCKTREEFFKAVDKMRTKEHQQIAQLREENQQLREVIANLEREEDDNDFEVEDNENPDVEGQIDNASGAQAPTEAEEAPAEAEELRQAEETEAQVPVNLPFIEAHSLFQKLYLLVLYCYTFVFTTVRLFAQNESQPVRGSPVPQGIGEAAAQANGEPGAQVGGEPAAQAGGEPGNLNQNPNVGNETTSEEKEEPIRPKTLRNAKKTAKKLMRLQKAEDLMDAKDAERESASAQVKNTSYIWCLLKYVIVLVISIGVATLCLPGASSMEIGEDASEVLRDNFPSLSCFETAE